MPAENNACRRLCAVCTTCRYIPFGHRALGAVLNNAIALDAAGKLDTPIRRQLLGLEYADGRPNWFDEGFCARTPRPDLR